jgi:hypothetical protein
MVVDGAVVMVENIVRRVTHPGGRTELLWSGFERQRTRSRDPVFLRDCHHHHSLSPNLYAATCRRASPSSIGLDSGARVARRSLVFDDARSRASERLSEARQEWRNPVMGKRSMGHRASIHHVWRGAPRFVFDGVPRVQRRDRLRVSAASGQRRSVGTRNPCAEHRAN